MAELFDATTEKVLLRVSLSRKAQAQVVTYGDVDVAALDKLIQLLIMTRNDWVGEMTEDATVTAP